MTLSPIGRWAGMLSLVAAGAGGTARPVVAIPDPVGDRDRLDRTHLGVGISQLADRGDSGRGKAMKPLRTIAIRLFVVVACSIVLVVLGTASAAADDGPDLAAIDRYVRSEMDAQRIPGLALGIVHGDRIVHVQGFGQVEKSGPDVTSQTPFLIGSVTKSFTALAIMQLSEAGRVQLDAPVQRYLPWWRVADPDASTRVTVRQLLYQVSGLSKATGNAYATSGDTHESALEDRVRALRDAELTQPVGTTWQYSNANYWTLGMIVQAVSGQSYESYIQQHVFDPLEMRNSYTSQAEAEQHGLPTGHRYWYGFPVAAELSFDRGGLGSGGLSSSAQDMTRYIGLYLDHGRHGDTALVSPAGAAELQRAGVATGLDGVSYAMGWDVSQVRGLRTISHDGSGFDSHANVVLIPDRQWGVVVMENGENSPDEFFGSRRMTAIANGVAVMLIGEQAPAPSSASTSLWVVYGLVLGILLIQLVGMVRSVRTIRGWRASPLLRPRGALRIGLRVGLPLLVSWTWALIVLVVLPRIIRAPLPAVLMGLPDLGYPLVASEVLAFGWGLVRAIWALRAAPPGAPSPPTGATTHLSLSTS
jgi:CubicO group peptidase (beta-lactamase class C family)